MKWSAVNSYKARITLLFSTFLIIILTATLIPACNNGGGTTTTDGGGPTTAPPGAITLTLVSGWSDPWNGNVKLHEFVDRINKESKGKLFINYLGGAEVAPLSETGGLVRDGVFDMALVAPAYYAGLCPPAAMAHFVPPDPTVQRQLGITAQFDTFLRQRMGCTTPGFIWQGESFGIISSQPITSADWKGMLIHTLPILTAGLTYCGASTVSLTTAEFYVALERGVADAVPQPRGSVPYDLRLYEVAKYLLMPELPLYTSGPLLINLKRWDRLPADMQKLITDTLIDMEPGVYKYYVDSMNKYEGEMFKKGVKVTNLTGDDLKRYTFAFTTFAWQDMIRLNGDDGKKFFEKCRPLFEWAKTAPPY